MAAFNNKWLNPEDFKSFEEFHKAYTEERGRALAYQEIFNLLEGAEQRITDIRKQLDTLKRDVSYEL